MTPSETKKAFSDIMTEGLSVNRLSQEGDAIYYTDKEHLDKVFTRYQLWKAQIKNFLKNTKRDVLEWYKFYESDSVSLFKGDVDYEDVRSLKSQELLRNIRIESGLKLDLLKQLGNSIFDNRLPKSRISDEDFFELKKGKNYFSFNKITGDARLNNIEANFKFGQQKFVFILTLVNSEQNISDYTSIFSSLKWPTSEPSRKSLHNLVKTIKEDLKILPSNKKSSPDIFQNIEKKGYRLLLK